MNTSASQPLYCLTLASILASSPVSAGTHFKEAVQALSLAAGRDLNDAEVETAHAYKAVWLQEAIGTDKSRSLLLSVDCKNGAKVQAQSVRAPGLMSTTALAQRPLAYVRITDGQVISARTRSSHENTQNAPATALPIRLETIKCASSKANAKIAALQPLYDALDRTQLDGPIALSLGGLPLKFELSESVNASEVLGEASLDYPTSHAALKGFQSLTGVIQAMGLSPLQRMEWLSPVNSRYEHQFSYWTYQSTAVGAKNSVRYEVRLVNASPPDDGKQWHKVTFRVWRTHSHRQ